MGKYLNVWKIQFVLWDHWQGFVYWFWPRNYQRYGSSPVFKSVCLGFLEIRYFIDVCPKRKSED